MFNKLYVKSSFMFYNIRNYLNIFSDIINDLIKYSLNYLFSNLLQYAIPFLM